MAARECKICGRTRGTWQLVKGICHDCRPNPNPCPDRSCLGQHELVPCPHKPQPKPLNPGD
jgi:hypothetical protein